MGRAGDKRREGAMHDPRLSMFGLSLKHHRERRGWTQEQVAILLHYEDQAMICMIEKGVRAPSFLQAVEIAQLFETTVNEMCGYRLPGGGGASPRRHGSRCTMASSCSGSWTAARFAILSTP